MTHRERLETVFAGKTADRTPCLGGWIASPDHICAIAALTPEEYWSDPWNMSIRAYHKLGCDGLIGNFIPAGPGSYRMDEHSFARADKGLTLEQCVEMIEKMPAPEKIEEQFDLDAEYAKHTVNWKRNQGECGDMVWMPAWWDAGAKITWFFDFGYENFFLIMGLYPELSQKLMEVGGALGYCQSRLIARGVREGLYPHAMHFGEDICTQRGPMVSPEFMEKYYAPALKRGLEPLLEVNCKPVWHSDGDIRPIMDMLIDCGVQGFQGFQPECGLTIDYVVQKRTREGKPLLIFGPLAVTTELPVCTPEQVRQKVRHAVEVCKGNADLVLFTSNTINPDVPLANIYAMHEAIGSMQA